jgi:SAM-dependent methyltransferase
LTNGPSPDILIQEVMMAALQIHDQKVLQEEAYADDSHLDVRYRTHQLYTVDPVDFGRWTLERLMWQGDERVLDMGCARGDLIREMAHQADGWGILVGFDLSPGMVAKGMQLARALPMHLFAADAQSLPFPDDLFDVVMARHMLYHVPDIRRAVAEAARTLRPGGYFLATTNSARTMPEYEALRQRASERFSALTQPGVLTDRFSLENAASYLEAHFDRVETYTLPGTLRFPNALPFMDYFASSRALIMHPEHTDAEWRAVLGFVRAEVEAIIAHDGRFDVTKITGAVVGVKGG